MENHSDMIDISLFNRHHQEIQTIPIDSIESVLQDHNNLVWIDIEYTADLWPSPEIENLLQNSLKIHPLNVEDCVISKQNPKIEDYGEYIFAIVYGIKKSTTQTIQLDEIDIAIGKNYVLTYRHCPIPEVEDVKQAFKSKINHIHKNSSRLFYTIMDHIIDGYQAIIEDFDVNIDKLGNRLFKEPNQPTILIQLNAIKELLSEVRSIVIAEEGMFLNTSKGLYSILNEEKNIFFKDLYDHLNKVLDRLDKQSKTISNLFLVQMNLSTQKLNELIKFLTIISAVLLPANLMAGIFGMNFQVMPLLQNTLGFYLVLGCMITIGLVMILFFIRKKWI